MIAKIGRIKIKKQRPASPELIQQQGHSRPFERVQGLIQSATPICHKTVTAYDLGDRLAGHQEARKSEIMARATPLTMRASRMEPAHEATDSAKWHVGLAHKSSVLALDNRPAVDSPKPQNRSVSWCRKASIHGKTRRSSLGLNLHLD